MTGAGHDDSGDTADVFHGILKEHQVHNWVVVVVDCETFVDVGKEFFVGHDIIKSVLTVHTTGEVAENQVFWTVGEVTVERVT